MADERITHFGAGAVDEVQDTIWKLCVHKRAQEVLCSQRSERRGLEDNRVAGDEGRRDLPRWDRDREVPWRDDRNHTQGLSLRVEDLMASRGWNHFRAEAPTFASVVPEDVDRAADLSG